MSKIFHIFLLSMVVSFSQEKNTISDFNFPTGIKELELNEFEVNRVSGEKILFKTTKYEFLNDLLQSKITTFDNASTKTEKYYYSKDLLVKYEYKSEDYVYVESYEYNSKKQLIEIKVFDQNIQSNAIIFKYNKKGKIAKKIIKEIDGTISCIEEYFYSSNTNYLKRESFKYQTQEGIVNEYYFENNLEILTKYDVKGEAFSIVNKKYDEKRNLIEIDQPLTTFINKYNEKGWLIQTNCITDDTIFYAILEYQYKM